MKYLFFVAITIASCGCNSNPVPADPNAKTNPKGQSTPHTTKQINLTILLDLSDRINPKKNPDSPEHFRKDTILIKDLTDYFLGQMQEKGTYMAKGKMRVVFLPNPPDPKINDAAKNLSIDLSRMDPEGKKKVYDNLGQTVSENIGIIYKNTIDQGKWPGSDIWRFFKNDVSDVAIEPDSNYRNLLVIFTDGYLFHEDSKDNSGNRYAYLTTELIEKYKLRNNDQWQEKMAKSDFGLISKRSDLEALEVLVLEVTPSAKHKDDDDIIHAVLQKWFTEMKVKKFKIINTDLPTNTKPKIDAFLKN